jgi:broad specificity phosphatase PhoE
MKPPERRSLREIIEDAVKGEPSVYLVRHGTTALNRGGAGKDLIRGWADVPLSKEGVEQAHRIAEDLADCDFEIIRTSDLIRAEKTADIIRDSTGGEVESLEELRSWNLGPKFEGKLTNPTVVDQIKHFVENADETPEGGESFNDFVERVIKCAEPIFEEARGETAIVTHGRCVQIISLWIAADCDLECMQRDYAEELAAEPDSISPGGYLELKKIDGRWRAMEEENYGAESEGIGDKAVTGS